jgi:hypothetical protein
VVQVDIPKVAYRSVIEPGMEIFIAHQYVEYITGNGNGNFEMAFLKL